MKSEDFLKVLEVLPPNYRPMATTFSRTIYLKVEGRLFSPLIAVIAAQTNQHERLPHTVEKNWRRAARELDLSENDAALIMNAVHISTIKEVRDFRKKLLAALKLPPDPHSAVRD